MSSTKKPSTVTLGGSTHVPLSLLVERIGEVGQSLGTCRAKGPNRLTPEGSVPPSLSAERNLVLGEAGRSLGLYNTRGPSYSHS